MSNKECFVKPKYTAANLTVKSHAHNKHYNKILLLPFSQVVQCLILNVWSTLCSYILHTCILHPKWIQNTIHIIKKTLLICWNIPCFVIYVWKCDNFSFRCSEFLKLLECFSNKTYLRIIKTYMLCACVF